MTMSTDPISYILQSKIPALGCTVSEASGKVQNAANDILTVCFPFPFGNLLDDWAKTQSEQLGRTIQLTAKISAHRVQSTLKGLPNIKNCIAIASGKGGVGKSTVTAQFAVALAKLGAKVGILDADIYGPSQPMMFGTNSQKPESVAGRHLKPVRTQHGIQIMSMGYLLADDNTPVVWRGPMVSKALQQLLFETLWDDLDYLLIDLPPGTGDIQLTLCQKIPLSGSVIVTTPQDIALLDVTKAIRMFEKVHVNMLGVIENMSSYHCPNCQHIDPIFSQGGAEKIKSTFNLDCLGQIPLDRRICEAAEKGDPSLLGDSDAITQAYLSAAWQTTRHLALQAKNYAVKFPNIVVKTN